MLILDYSQVALSNIFQFQSDLKKDKVNPDAVNIIRHAILTGIKMYKKKYSSQYGEVVISCDGKQYWRKQMFPYYKAGRSKTRESSDLDWSLIFDTMSTIRDDLATYFPYKVIHLEEIESDDIIATLCKWTQTNEFIDRGMFEEKQPVIVISSDGDFKQLHKYDNVRQWSPMQKKFVQCNNPSEYLNEHIAGGDRGDGIPNILSPDDVFVTEGTRQGKMTAKRLQEFISTGRQACKTESEQRNWDRNNALINFDAIPDRITDAIVNKFVSLTPRGDKMSVYNYLVKHRCRLLLEEVEEF